jgi:class 3 adenylate cyclase
LYLTIAISFLILVIIFRMRPVVLFITGLCLSAIAAFGYGVIFVIYGYWLDPAIIFGSSTAGMFVVFFCKCISLNSRARHFRIAYGSAVSRIALRELIGRGRPNVTEVTVAAVTVIAIRDFTLLNKEDREKAGEAGKAVKSFHTAVKNIIFSVGAVIAGYEGDTIIACFGSPLERECDFESDPVPKACRLVKKLLNSNKTSWRFGMDAGKCTFSWSPETGFTANGPPVVRAKILASKNARYKTRALITDPVREETNLNVRQIGYLRNNTDAFYELTGN